MELLRINPVEQIIKCKWTNNLGPSFLVTLIIYYDVYGGSSGNVDVRPGDWTIGGVEWTKLKQCIMLAWVNRGYD